MLRSAQQGCRDPSANRPRALPAGRDWWPATGGGPGIVAHVRSDGPRIHAGELIHEFLLRFSSVTCSLRAPRARVRVTLPAAASRTGRGCSRRHGCRSRRPRSRRARRPSPFPHGSLIQTTFRSPLRSARRFQSSHPVTASGGWTSAARAVSNGPRERPDVGSQNSRPSTRGPGCRAPVSSSSVGTMSRTLTWPCPAAAAGTRPVSRTIAGTRSPPSVVYALNSRRSAALMCAHPGPGQTQERRPPMFSGRRYLVCECSGNSHPDGPPDVAM